MSQDKLALVAHLMRRAGFGATRSELEVHLSSSYEALVEDLLHPDRLPEVEEDVLSRYYPELTSFDAVTTWRADGCTAW